MNENNPESLDKQIETIFIEGLPASNGWQI
jgi:hypothetical protein